MFIFQQNVELHVMLEDSAIKKKKKGNVQAG